MPPTEKVIGLTLLVLVIAFIFPVVMNAAEDGRTVSTENYTEGDPQTIEGALVVEATSIMGGEVTVNVTSVNSSDTASVTLSEGDTGTVMIDGTEVVIDAVDVTSQNATLSIEYDTTLGWDGPAKRFSELIPLLILVSGFSALMFIGAKWLL